jgi:hypothetical protein
MTVIATVTLLSGCVGKPSADYTEYHWDGDGYGFKSELLGITIIFPENFKGIIGLKDSVEQFEYNSPQFTGLYNEDTKLINVYFLPYDETKIASIIVYPFGAKEYTLARADFYDRPIHILYEDDDVFVYLIVSEDVNGIPAPGASSAYTADEAIKRIIDGECEIRIDRIFYNDTER